MGRFGTGLDFFRQVVINACRAYFLGDAGGVFRLIVKKFMLRVRYNFDNRQSLQLPVADDTDGKLRPIDVSLNQHGGIVGSRFIHGSLQVGGRSYDGHSHAGAPLHGFDHQGQADFSHATLNVHRITAIIDNIRGYGEAGLFIQPLGRILVHGQRAAQDTRALEGNVEQLQKTLHRPIFAIRPV